ncbi:MAG: bifunctional histidinol-phosphatase/imidazoleglycerol-phosphate dehydratase HisB, partial [Bacteroidetes bacterium]
MKKVLFLDRDGTILIEPSDTYQVDSLDRFAFLPGAIRNLLKIKAHTDYEWVIVTNQDGLGTASFPEENFWPAQNLMLDILRSEGITFTDIFIDRTFKHEQAPTRKPNTGLLGKYLDGSYDLAQSLVIGDRPTDVLLARNLGAKAILLGRSLDDQDNDVSWEELRETLLFSGETWDEIGSFILKINALRKAHVHRVTRETDVEVRLDLDGTGVTHCETGVGFFDHMLDQLGKHSRCNIEVKTTGDLHIDEHHTIEDTALAIGEAYREALGDKRGIERYGFFSLVMDDALAEVAIDFSGRPWLTWQAAIPGEKTGDFPVEMTEHFFKSFSDAARCNLHVRISGRNAHHMIEAAFKSLARAIRLAITH